MVSADLSARDGDGVDLAGLGFINSSGVAALARGRKLARHPGGCAGGWGSRPCRGDMILAESCA